MATPLQPTSTGPTDSFRWRGVSSSFIDDVKHQNGRVKVSISGRTYEYSDPTGKKYQGIIQAGSKGRYFNRNIKRTGSGRTARFRRGSR